MFEFLLLISVVAIAYNFGKSRTDKEKNEMIKMIDKVGETLNKKMREITKSKN